jgi:hypothetical protein
MFGEALVHAQFDSPFSLPLHLAVFVSTTIIIQKSQLIGSDEIHKKFNFSKRLSVRTLHKIFTYTKKSVANITILTLIRVYDLFVENKKRRVKDE